MKNSRLSKIALTSVLTLSTFEAFATFKPQFYCQATCIVINHHEKILHTLGPIKGFSELDTVEAFDDMNQNCVNLATHQNFNGTNTALITGRAFISEYQKKERFNSKSVSNSSESLPGYRIKNWRLIANENLSSKTTTSQFESDEDQFAYEVNFADENNCKPFVQKSNGRPKYIGSETPLG